jgi:GTP-binding protein
LLKCTCPKVSEGTPQMLITSLDFHLQVVSLLVVLRCFERRYANLIISKRDGTVSKSRIKELHTFEGLGQK